MAAPPWEGKGVSAQKPPRTHKACKAPLHSGERWLPVEAFPLKERYLRQDGHVSLYRGNICAICQGRIQRARHYARKGYSDDVIQRLAHRRVQRQRARAAGTRYCAACDNPYIQAQAMSKSCGYCVACTRERSRVRRYERTGILPPRHLHRARPLINEWRRVSQGMSIRQQQILTGLGSRSLWEIRKGLRTHATTYVIERLKQGIARRRMSGDTPGAAD